MRLLPNWRLVLGPARLKHSAVRSKRTLRISCCRPICTGGPTLLKDIELCFIRSAHRTPLYGYQVTTSGIQQVLPPTLPPPFAVAPAAAEPSFTQQQCSSIAAVACAVAPLGVQQLLFAARSATLGALFGATTPFVNFLIGAISLLGAVVCKTFVTAWCGCPSGQIPFAAGCCPPCDPDCLPPNTCVNGLCFHTCPFGTTSCGTKFGTTLCCSGTANFCGDSGSCCAPCGSACCATNQACIGGVCLDVCPADTFECVATSGSTCCHVGLFCDSAINCSCPNGFFVCGTDNKLTSICCPTGSTCCSGQNSTVCNC